MEVEQLMLKKEEDYEALNNKHMQQIAELGEQCDDLSTKYEEKRVALLVANVNLYECHLAQNVKPMSYSRKSTPCTIIIKWGRIKSTPYCTDRKTKCGL
mgnify:FL=1